MAVIGVSLLLVLFGVWVVRMIPIAEDLNSDSFATYDGVCTVLSERGGGRAGQAFSEKYLMLDGLDITVVGNTNLERGKYEAHVVYSEKSEYVVEFSLKDK